MIDKVYQESDEYRMWKEGSATVDSNSKEGNQTPENTINQVSEKKTVDNSQEPVRKKVFFLDWFFGIKTHKGQMKMMYYLFSFFFYYLFCVVMVYFIERMPDLNIYLVIYFFFLAIPVAIILPFILLFLGFTLSGGIFIGMFVGIFSWMFGLGGRFLYKLFRYDMKLLFPEFVGKKGEICKYSLLGKYSPYPYAATISKMGLPGDSIFYNERFSVRSDEKLELGMKVEIIKHEIMSITSLVKNHPTFLVRPIDEKIILNKEKI